MKLIYAAAAVAAIALPTGAALAAPPGDTTIDLPSGFFAGEGISSGAGNTFYAGSLDDGRIARGDLVAGTSELWVDDPAVSPAVGIDADVRHGVLWVAGGPSGQAAVYSLDSGDAVATMTLTDDESVINDVVATRSAAYFTNSFSPEIYRVSVSPTGDIGQPEVISLSGPAADFGPDFNLNGIDATANGNTLIAVNTATGELYTIDSLTGASASIDLGTDSVATGDGIALSGRWLYVLQNGAAPGVPNQIAVIKPSGDLSSGELTYTVTSPLFETATTLDLRGSLIAAVNAQFADNPIDPETEVVLLRSS